MQKIQGMSGAKNKVYSVLIRERLCQFQQVQITVLFTNEILAAW